MSNLWLNMRIGKYRIQCGRDNGLTIRKFEGLDRNMSEKANEILNEIEGKW